MKLTPEQKRVKRIINDLKHYINTYDKQFGYLDYQDETIISDILYGLGIALEPEKYEWADGFLKFREEILSKYIPTIKQ